MKKPIIIISIIILAFVAYANLSAVNTRQDYIEACLYISTTDALKDSCYGVYPESHGQDALVWGIISIVGIILLLIAYNKKQNDFVDNEADVSRNS